MVATSTPAPESSAASSAPEKKRHPTLWVPSLYVAMGIPFNVIMSGTASSMYKELKLPDAQITVALGYMGIAWSAKPLWAAFLDMYRTKKFFVLFMELLLAALFASVGLALGLPSFFSITVAIFYIAAFSSSTQDICGDGVYLTSLDRASQARWAGLQGTFWVTGKVIATGVLISQVEKLANSQSWSLQSKWTVVMLIAGAMMGVFALYHYFMLPTGEVRQRPENARAVFREFAESGRAFFDKRMIWGMIAFVFLYRIGEGFILMEGRLFLQSSHSVGGLGFTAGQVADIDAVYGTIASLLGGMLGGPLAARVGLKRSIIFLALCLNVPHVTFMILSQLGASGHGADYWTVVALVSIEKFGYGFGFVGNMIHMMHQLAPGQYRMTHYAFATALMNLVLIPTNMASGPLAQWLGFKAFFIFVLFASVPSIVGAWLAPFPQEGLPEGKFVDDETKLSETEKVVQRIAGRASIYAMLALLLILVIDVGVLGAMETSTGTLLFVLFGFLVASLLLKGVLVVRSMRTAGEAIVECNKEQTPNPYRSNALGAYAASAIAVALAIGTVALGANRAFH